MTMEQLGQLVQRLDLQQLLVVHCALSLVGSVSTFPVYHLPLALYGLWAVDGLQAPPVSSARRPRTRDRVKQFASSFTRSAPSSSSNNNNNANSNQGPSASSSGLSTVAPELHAPLETLKKFMLLMAVSLVIDVLWYIANVGFSWGILMFVLALVLKPLTVLCALSHLRTYGVRVQWIAESLFQSSGPLLPTHHQRSAAGEYDALHDEIDSDDGRDDGDDDQGYGGEGPAGSGYQGQSHQTAAVPKHPTSP
ncbi:hypothetical protein H4R35_002791 [Dimargaris xerosporica]|nr:hypothetical protein H4R35_002791 [Dimargaris xerosporica]